MALGKLLSPWLPCRRPPRRDGSAGHSPSGKASARSGRCHSAGPHRRRNVKATVIRTKPIQTRGEVASWSGFTLLETETAPAFLRYRIFGRKTGCHPRRSLSSGRPSAGPVGEGGLVPENALNFAAD